jgi:hypothetical protein
MTKLLDLAGLRAIDPDGRQPIDADTTLEYTRITPIDTRESRADSNRTRPGLPGKPLTRKNLREIPISVRIRDLVMGYDNKPWEFGGLSSRLHSGSFSGD